MSRLLNHPCNYRYPLYVLTDDDYAPRGAITVEPDTGRTTAHTVTGDTIADRKDTASAIRAAEEKGYRVVSSSWYGVGNGRPADAYGRELGLTQEQVDADVERYGHIAAWNRLDEREALRREARQEALLGAGAILAEHRAANGEE